LIYAYEADTLGSQLGYDVLQVDWGAHYKVNLGDQNNVELPSLTIEKDLLELWAVHLGPGSSIEIFSGNAPVVRIYEVPEALHIEIGILLLALTDCSGLFIRGLCANPGV